jgi:pimeloyl-ACP methyl ester carboxylesterase
MNHQFIDVEGVKLHYVEAKPHKPAGTIIFLHGFPEYWASWQQQMNYFSQQYQVIAPDLPGYNLSDKPNDIAFYQLAKLIPFMAKFVQQVCEANSAEHPVFLVAHDWGGAIAWPLVAFYPQLFNKLIVLNAAHPSTFTREMYCNPEQQKKSHYIHQLTAKDGPKRVRNNDFSLLRNMLFEGTCRPVFDEKQQADYLAVWQQTDAVEGMLSYYLMMPQQPPLLDKTDDTQQIKQVAKIPNIRISVPTLILWGEQDEAFVSDVLSGIENYVSDCQIIRFGDASHWLHHEQPQTIAKHIEEFIAVAT